MYELRQLQCFVAVAEEGHFGRAASRLNMTQPPLSRQIQNLEYILNAQLLERTSRVVRLTHAGRLFLPEAVKILSNVQQSILIARRSPLGTSGLVRIAFTGASAYSFLPKLLAHLRRVSPDVDFVLRDMLGIDQADAIASGQVDVSFQRTPIEAPGVNSVSVMSERVVAAVPRTSELAKKPRLELADFDQQSFIMYSPHGSPHFYHPIMTLFAQSGVSPNFIQYVDQVHTILALAQAGLGHGLVPQSASTFRYDGVVFRPVDGTSKAIVQIFMNWSQQQQSPVVESFVNIARRFGESWAKPSGR